MTRRTFFANLFGGIGAALWPGPPKPVVCAEPHPPLSWSRVGFNEDAPTTRRTAEFEQWLSAMPESAFDDLDPVYARACKAEGGELRRCRIRIEFCAEQIASLPGLCDLAYRP